MILGQILDTQSFTPYETRQRFAYHLSGKAAVEKLASYGAVYSLKSLVFGALFVCGIWISPNSSAGEIKADTSRGYGINIQGQIVKGDYDTFIAVFSELTTVNEGRLVFPYYISISSPGGNLREALKIADFVERLKLEVHMAGNCNSACVFILVASPMRTFCCSLGLHRPTFSAESLTGMSLLEAESKFNSLLASSKIWLAKHHVHQQAVDALINTPSFDAHVIDHDEGERLIGSKAPGQQEWMAARCGFLTDREEDDWQIAAFDKMSRENKLGSLKDEPWVAMQLQRAKNMSPAYLEYLLNKKTGIESCENTALRSYRLEVLPNMVRLDASERASLINQ